jgi:hypothetical protein
MCSNLSNHTGAGKGIGSTAGNGFIWLSSFVSLLAFRLSSLRFLALSLFRTRRMAQQENPR